MDKYEKGLKALDELLANISPEELEKDLKLLGVTPTNSVC